MPKGQGALEYLLLIGGAVLVAVIAIAFVVGLSMDRDFGNEQCKQNGYDKVIDIHRSTDGNYIYAITCEVKIKREEWK